MLVNKGLTGLNQRRPKKGFRFPVHFTHIVRTTKHTPCNSLGAKFSCRCIGRFMIRIMCISLCWLKAADEPQRTQSSGRTDAMWLRASGVHREGDLFGRLMRSSLLICFHVFSCNTLNYLLSILLLQNAEKHSFKCVHLLGAPSAHLYLIRQDEK